MTNHQPSPRAAFLPIAVYPITTRIRLKCSSIRKGLKSADIFSCDLAFDRRVEQYLEEHVLQRVVVVPAATQIETVLAAAQQAFSAADSTLSRISLESIEFRQALVLPDGDDPLEIRLEAFSDDGDFEIGSRKQGGAEPWTVHTRGRIRIADKGEPFVDFVPDEIRQRLPTEILSSDLYRAVGDAGLELGPSFRGIKELWSDGRETIARISVPETIAAECDRHLLHPAVLDATLQATFFGPSYLSERSLFIPFRVRRISLHRPLRGKSLWCYSRIDKKTADQWTMSIWAKDEAGEPVLSISDLIGYRVSRDATATPERKAHFYEPVWKERPASPRDSQFPETWIVLSPGLNDEIARFVVDSLARKSERVVVCYPGDKFCRVSKDAFTIRPDKPEDYKRLLGEVDDLDGIEGIAHLWTLGCDSCNGGSLTNAQVLGPESVTTLTKTLDNAEKWSRARAQVWLVTTGAQAVNSEEERSLNTDTAPLVGFGRVLRSEYPQLSSALMDIGASPSEAEAEALLCELELGVSDREIALRGDKRFVRVLQSADVQPSTEVRPVDVRSTKKTFAATVKTPGMLGSIALRERPVATLGPDDVEIAVKATGLNFKDVVVGLGMLDAEAFRNGLTGADLGMDCAGVVMRVGANVRNVRVGDEVMGIAPRCPGNRAVTHYNLIVRKPAGLSAAAGMTYLTAHLALTQLARLGGPRSLTDAQASGLPAPYVTASAALEDVARVQAGETVLIHAASGGVGIAAVQIAKRLGTKIIGTAGSEAKRDFVRSLGVEHVFNSRSPDFYDEVMAVTSGRGVDVVLNSLSGRALPQGLRCLAPFGRFVEIGKGDIFNNRQIGLRALAHNRSYLFLDVDEWLVARKNEVQRVLQQCAADLESGRFQPLPVTSFPMSQAAEAIQFLAQAKHIGKVVVGMPESGTLQVEPSDRLCLDPDGVYLVSGGCGGWGLATAGWLVERGARKVVLFSRSGQLGAEDAAQVEEMKGRGAEVFIRACDVTDAEAVCSLVADSRTRGHIAGIVHAATVLDDAPIALLDGERLARVLRPKVRGAINLHEATRADSLDFFVMFSSISSILGTPGQANYAAANAFLDSFAVRLRASGVPATSINWGALDEVGILARVTPEQRRKILGRGVRAFNRAQVFPILEKALLSQRAQVIAADLDWEQLRSSGFINIELADAIPSEASSDRAKTLREELLAIAPEERSAKLAAAIAALVAKITGQAIEAVDTQTSLTRLGLDSLNAVEVDVWMERNFGVSTPTVQLLRGPTSLELAEDVLKKMASDPTLPGKASRPGDGRGGIRCLKSATATTFKLICFPYMSGSGDAYLRWTPLLPPEWELYVFDWPDLAGDHGALLRGPVEGVEQWLLDALAPCLDGPFAFYGHSMGGWIALAIADRHFRQTGRLPKIVGIGALPTPEVASKFLHFDAASPEDISEEFLLGVAKLLQVPSALLAAPVTRTRVIETIRRDVWLGSRAKFTANNATQTIDAPLPMLLFGGAQDSVPTFDKRAGQAMYGITPIAVKCVPGGHLFIDDEQGRKEVVEELIRHVR